ncbi:MAG: hypothetical protein QM638_21660 [Nocardioides sp.]|uniref:hypothetical protein n=1 Tax=Nocardioides sp. TaxID=35761 RepID=UPI0039E39498
MKTRSRSVVPLSLGIAVLVAALGACGGENDAGLAAKRSSTDASGVDTDVEFASYHRSAPWGTGDSAALEGRIDVKHGCVATFTSDGRTVIPVLPDDTTSISDDGNAMVVEGRSYQFGTNVTFSGGYFMSSERDWNIPKKACRMGDGGYFLVSGD